MFVIISFSGLILSFVNSDFSNETVFNHSHTTKPLFYKISGTWGNHEGSMLMWIVILSVFGAGLALTQKTMVLLQKSSILDRSASPFFFGGVSTAIKIISVRIIM